MSARPLNIIVSLTPQDGSIREVHFTLQQLRILEARGLVSGIMKASFSLPLNFLTKDEIDKKEKKKYDALFKRLMESSIKIGLQIIDFRDVIDKKVDEIRNQKRRLMKKDPTPEIEKEIAQLDRDEKIFKNHKKELEEIDDQRRNMSSDADIEDTEHELRGFIYRFKDFLETLRMRNKSNKYNMEADGIDTTSAHSTKRRNTPKTSDPESTVLDMSDFSAPLFPGEDDEHSVYDENEEEEDEPKPEAV